MVTEHIVRLNIEDYATCWWRHIVHVTQDVFFRRDVISVTAVQNSPEFIKCTREKFDELLSLSHQPTYESVFLLSLYLKWHS
jgi:hypothetical protein